MSKELQKVKTSPGATLSDQHDDVAVAVPQCSRLKYICNIADTS